VYIILLEAFMSGSTTLTVRLSPQTKKQLGRLAAHTRRTRSYLAGEAITNFVERELAIVEGIKRGLDDMHAGRVVPHKTAMRRLRATARRVAKSKP
jgi:predicted transcriptional regulator